MTDRLTEQPTDQPTNRPTDQPTAHSSDALTDALTRSTVDGLINREKAQSGGGGDHFAKAGSNDRVWNALEKHCLFDPENFARYYGSDCIAMAAEAWLGRGYQVTAQVNRVNPGGTAQKPHRDYHLGFMLPSQTLAFPRHVHAMSPFLTLQGAVAQRWRSWPRRPATTGRACRSP